MARVRVAVVFGGRSSEHAISCVSGGAIMRALDADEFEVIPVGIATNGRWVMSAVDPDSLVISDGVLPTVVVDDPGATASPDPTQEFLGGVDVVFPVLHGPWGEDGTVQGLLELAGVPYVGSGVMSSAATMDKAVMKALLLAAGLPVGPYEVITDAQWRSDRDACVERAAALGLPVFVKPARAGSSIGITKVHESADLIPAIEAAREHDPKVIVEASIGQAREIECGVLMDVDGLPMASRCAEIIVHGDHEFYDFAAKYLDDSAELVVPASLDPQIEERVRELATVAFTSLDCEGLARVDFFVSGSSIVINEVNTMPGFTPISMFPRMWQESGMDYSTLVRHLVHDALRRGTGLR